MKRISVAWFVALLAAPALAMAGCGGSSSQQQATTCPNDPRADTYVPGLMKMGKGEVFQAELVASDPAPPDRGDNAWTIKLSDAEGQPVVGATIDVKPFMPDHGHGTPVPAVVTDQGDGSYQLTPINLFMAGYWQVTLTIQAGGQSDQIVYGFCIEG